MINNVVYSGVVDPRHHLHRRCSLVPWIERRFTKDDTRAPPPRPAARRRRTARPPAPRRSRSSPCCSSAGRRTSSPARSTSRSATSRRSCRSPPLVAPADRRTTSTWRLCQRAAVAPGPERTERAGGIVRDAGGGYHAAERPRSTSRDRRRAVGRGGGRVMIGQLAPPLTEQAEDIDRVWNGFLLGAVVLGVLVAGLIAVRGRALPPARRRRCRASCARTSRWRSPTRRPAAHRRRPVRRDVRDRRRRRRRRRRRCRPRRRRSSASSGNGSSTTRTRA